MKKLIVILFITVSVFSCQRDEFENQPNDSAISIQNAKTWYEANNPEKIDLKSGLTGDEKNLKPDWKSAVKSENKKYEVVTVDLLTDRGFGFTSEENQKAWIETGEFRYIQSVTRLIILKDKLNLKTISFIMTITGDKLYLEKKKFNLSGSNSYLQKDIEFSGLIFYHELDGSFVNGWKYMDGKVTHTVKLQSEADFGIQLKSATICTTEYYTGWYYVEKYDAYAGVAGSEGYQGTTYDIVYYSFPITTCYEVGGNTGTSGTSGDSGTSGGGGGDVQGGYDPPEENPCNCTSYCPDCGGCLELELKSAEIPSDGSSGTSSTNPCPACSCSADCKIAASIGIDCNQLLVFEEDYKAQMSTSERQIFEGLTRIQQLSYLANAQFASWAAESKYPNELWNGKGDALRHAYWNAFNVVDLGFDLTEFLTSAHENKPSSYEYSYKETAMDLFNNEVGREIAINWQRNPSGSLEQAIYDAINRGELRYLNNLHTSGRATSSSQLTPTNQ